MTTPPFPHRWLKGLAWGVLALLGLVLGGSALSNFFFPAHSDAVNRLTDLDKAYVEEVFHLRHALGDSIWPGWANASIPIVVYNEEFAFLIGMHDPSPGWRSVPWGRPAGGPWAVVPGDSIEGSEYYRQRLPQEGATPQSFTVRVGDRLAASLATRSWTTIKMGNDIRDGLPPVIRHFAPYRLIAQMFLGLAMSSDGYICAMGHESFHAFQGTVVPAHLADAEEAFARLANRYPWDDEQFNKAWKTELSALADALRTKEEVEAKKLCLKFLRLRHARRVSTGLDSVLVSLEQLREWEEGVAKYAELALWKQASTDSAYRPVNAMMNNPDFARYKAFGQKWAEEMTTLRLQSSGGETRFYYSGMAQAFLLDRLFPGWKERIFLADVALEDLLQEAVTSRAI